MASSSSSSENRGGIGLLGAIFIVFLVMKLLGKIGWSWWWVTSPLWIPWAVVLGVLLFVGVLKLVFGGTKTKRKQPTKFKRLG